MERYIGLDVHAASCTLAVISEKGRKLKDSPVETDGQALVEAVRMIPGHEHLVIEEGLQSAWLYETLHPHVDELVVVGGRPLDDAPPRLALHAPLPVGDPVAASSRASGEREFEHGYHSPAPPWGLGAASPPV